MEQLLKNFNVVIAYHMNSESESYGFVVAFDDYVNAFDEAKRLNSICAKSTDSSFSYVVMTRMQYLKLLNH